MPRFPCPDLPEGQVVFRLLFTRGGVFLLIGISHDIFKMHAQIVKRKHLAAYLKLYTYPKVLDSRSCLCGWGLTGERLLPPPTTRSNKLAVKMSAVGRALKVQKVVMLKPMPLYLSANG